MKTFGARKLPASRSLVNGMRRAGHADERDACGKAATADGPTPEGRSRCVPEIRKRRTGTGERE